MIWRLCEILRFEGCGHALHLVALGVLIGSFSSIASTECDAAAMQRLYNVRECGATRE